jgi:hypothetical protein
MLREEMNRLEAQMFSECQECCELVPVPPSCGYQASTCGLIDMRRALRCFWVAQHAGLHGEVRDELRGVPQGDLPQLQRRDNSLPAMHEGGRL